MNYKSVFAVILCCKNGFFIIRKTKMSVLLKNGTYIDYKTLDFSQVDILASESGIEILQRGSSVLADKTIDCSGKYITHSFADGYMRPEYIFVPSSKYFIAQKTPYFKFLSDVLWKYSQNLDEDLLRASAMFSALQAVKNGCTFAIVRLEAPAIIEKSFEIVEQEFNRFGVSTLISYATGEINGYVKAEKALQANADYVKKSQGLMGIDASFLAGKELLEEVVSVCKQVGVGALINAGEDHIDEANTIRDYKTTAVQRLYDSGIMDFSSTILANCNVISGIERSCIKFKPCWTAENPIGNLQNAVSPFSSQWLDDNIFYGTDYTGENLVATTKMSYFKALGTENAISTMDAYQRLRAIHRYIEINGFKGDGQNNLIVFENPLPMELNKNNFVVQLIFGAKPHGITAVVSDGKLIVDNSMLLLADVAEIENFCRQQINRIIC